MQFGQALTNGARLLEPGTELKVLTTRWPPKYGWLSGPKAVVRSAARLLLPTGMQLTSLPGGTKKNGLIGWPGSPGSPSGLRHPQTRKSCCRDVAIANCPSLLTAALVSSDPLGICE